MAKRKRGQSAKRRRAGGARETAGPGATPSAPSGAQQPPPPAEAPASGNPAPSPKPEASTKAAKRPKRTSRPRARKAAGRGVSSGGEGDPSLAADADPTVDAPEAAPAVAVAGTARARERVEAARAAKSAPDRSPERASGPGASSAGPGSRLAELAGALTAEATRRRGLEERLRDVLSRRGDDVERARTAALLRTQAQAEATLERRRDKGGAEIEALRRDFRVARARLEADLGEAQAHFLRLRADVEERVAEAGAEAEAQTRRSLERVLARTERRAEIERKQLTAEIDRLRAELEVARRGETPSAIAGAPPAPVAAADAPAASVSTVAAVLAAAPQASPPRAKPAPAPDDQAGHLADAEERMRRCVLDAERTARDATEELDRVEERLHRELDASRVEVQRLQRDLEEARVEARVAQMLGEALRASRAEVERLKAQTRELAGRATASAAAELGASPPVPALPPEQGATGTRLLSVPELEAAGPPIPPPPPRRKRGRSTQIIEAGKAAVWQDNAKRMVQVSVGDAAGSHTPRSKVGRMRRAVTAADLESDPALKAATAALDEPLPDEAAALPDAAATEPPEVAKADPDTPLEIDFGPDE